MHTNTKILTILLGVSFHGVIISMYGNDEEFFKNILVPCYAPTMLYCLEAINNPEWQEEGIQELAGWLVNERKMLHTRCRAFKEKKTEIERWNDKISDVIDVMFHCLRNEESLRNVNTCIAGIIAERMRNVHAPDENMYRSGSEDMQKFINSLADDLRNDINDVLSGKITEAYFDRTD